MDNNDTAPETYNWYEFRQNNSGGWFVINESLSVYVLIQARNESEANNKAKEIGIYFDGCRKGHDCYCCGDRWHGADLLDEFCVYTWKDRSEKVFKNVRDFAQALANDDIWAKEGKPSVIVYFADGSVERRYKEHMN